MKKTGMNAITLRTILSVAVVALVGLSAVGFFFGQNWLRTFAVSVSQTVANSKASGNNIQTLKTLQQNLSARQDIITKANSIVASSQDYQTQTIHDLDKYATYADVAISNYNFAQTAAPVTPTAGTAPVATAAGTGSKSVTVTITSPISYTKLLKFMAAIESNLPKMQISSVNLGRVDGGDSNSVRTDQLTIEVYTQ
jgi:hypothetical protein